MFVLSIYPIILVFTFGGKGEKARGVLPGSDLTSPFFYLGLRLRAWMSAAVTAGLFLFSCFPYLECLFILGLEGQQEGGQVMRGKTQKNIQVSTQTDNHQAKDGRKSNRYHDCPNPVIERFSSFCCYYHHHHYYLLVFLFTNNVEYNKNVTIFPIPY